MKKMIINVAMTGATLGLSNNVTAADNLSTSADASTTSNVIVQIPKNAINSKKIIIKNKSVYVRIGELQTLDDGSKAVKKPDTLCYGGTFCGISGS